MKYIDKELVNTFSFTTINKDREGIKSVNINGRKYIKYGTYQAVTLVGNVYKYYEPSSRTFNYVLCIGVSKQHPGDIMINKEEAYENAQLKAITDPDMVIKMPNNIKRFTFVDIARNYVSSLDLKFVKTRQELEETGDIKLSYHDDYYLRWRAAFANKRHNRYDKYLEWYSSKNISD